jgi:hypothetical protein
VNSTLSPALRVRGGVGAAGWRALGLVALTGAVAAFLAYMVVNVPLVAPRLSRAEVTSQWGGAVIALGVVLAVVVAVVGITRARARGEVIAQGADGDLAALPQLAGTRPASARPIRRGIPQPLRRQRVSRRAVAVAALTSFALASLAALAGLPLQVGGLALLAPWFPLVFLEATWKYERYGVFALFAMLVLLQIVHVGEHTVQVTQLMATQGDLARSHGVFAQLDFELVHFLSDSGVWLSLGLLVCALGARNRWLWVAFAAASLHQVEHFYLFWLNTTHESLYAQGGFAGIMGEGGLIGSPLDRPYLHFAYNFLVVTPMAIALWDEAARIEER